MTAAEYASGDLTPEDTEEVIFVDFLQQDRDRARYVERSKKKARSFGNALLAIEGLALGAIVDSSVFTGEDIPLRIGGPALLLGGISAYCGIRKAEPFASYERAVLGFPRRAWLWLNETNESTDLDLLVNETDGLSPMERLVAESKKAYHKGNEPAGSEPAVPTNAATGAAGL